MIGVRLWNLFRRKQLGEDIREELDGHLSCLEDEERASGKDPKTARHNAMIRFGNPSQYKEQSRDAQIASWAEDLLRDTRLAVRQLAKSPIFSATIVLILSLGIGSTTILYSVVHQVLWTPLNYPESGQLVSIWSSMPSRGIVHADVSYPDYIAIGDKAHSLVEVGAYTSATYSVLFGNSAERVRGASTTASLLHLLRVQPLLGDVYASTAEQWGRHREVLLGEDLWRQRFGGDQSIIGHTININEEPYSVVGVMPASFHYPDSSSQMWTPIAFPPNSEMYTRGNYFLTLLGRLSPGATLAQCLAELKSIIQAVNPDVSVAAIGFQEALVGEARPILLLLFGAVLFVLLIVCVNVANLLMARATTRRKEIGVRLALGASTGRLLRQLMTESVLLSALGGGVGILLAFGALHLLKTWAPVGLPRLDEMSLDTVALGFAVAVTLITGFLFGIAPAFQELGGEAGRSALRENSRGTSSSRAAVWTRSALVILETGMSLMLVIGAGLLIVSLARLLQVDPGFRTENLLTMHLDLPPLRYREPSRSLGFINRAIERIQTLPGVSSVGATTSLPLEEAGGLGRLITVDGDAAPRSMAEIPVIQYRQATPDYFRALSIRLLRGRFFSGDDQQGLPEVAIINETLAHRIFQNKDPLGARVYLGPHEALRGPAGRFPRITIVGVIADLHHKGLDREPEPELFVPFAQAGMSASHSLTFAIHTERLPRATAAAVEGAIRQLDSDVPVSNVKTMDDLLASSLERRRFVFKLIATFALVAFIMAVTGIYGLVSYSVSQRIPEIGIRMALGARRNQIVQEVVRRGLRLALLGSVLGLILAFLLSQTMAGILFGVRPRDPIVYAISALLLFLANLAASCIPAYRASHIDPWGALRQQ